MARVVYDEVTKRFGEVTALRDFSLHIDDGEFMVLVGPSGSADHRPATARRASRRSPRERSVSGTGSNRLAPRDRDIAMVFQDYALYPQKSVYDNLAFGLRMRKMPRGRSTDASATPPRCSTSWSCSSAGRVPCRVGSGSRSLSAGRSCASRRRS